MSCSVRKRNACSLLVKLPDEDSHYLHCIGNDTRVCNLEYGCMWVFIDYSQGDCCLKFLKEQHITGALQGEQRVAPKTGWSVRKIRIMSITEHAPKIFFQSRIWLPSYSSSAILPGLRILLGSNNILMERITSKATGSCSKVI